MATAAVEREVVQDDEVTHVLSSDYEEAMACFRDRVEGFRSTLGASKVYLAFTGASNFRYRIYPQYKSGRKATRKPLCYWRCLDTILNSKNYVARRVDILEADDLMGIWATNGKIKNPIIVSDDKDMKTIPAKVFRQGELIDVTEEEADYWWMKQTLMGDPTDGVPGLPGCGTVTADKWLKGEANGATLWDRVMTAYTKKGLSEDDAILMARLVRILRAEDWDSEKQEVKLWTPSSR